MRPKVLDLIGNTPTVPLERLRVDGAAEVLAKLEGYNPAGSIKDRIALAMVEEAERQGALAPGGVIIEATSGNTGIGLAMVAAAKGYRCIVAMPEGMGGEREYLLRCFGAEVVTTAVDGGMAAAARRAEELAAETPGAFLARQFSNPANPEAHRRTTAVEILEATKGRLEAFVAGIGTGGTITGVGEVLKERVPGVRVIGVEPSSSPLLSQGRWGSHAIHGIGANFVPEVLNRQVLDEVRTVGDEDAFEMSIRLAREEGILAGVSAGAAVFVALQVVKELGSRGRVLTIVPDSAERCKSTRSVFRR